MLNFQLLLNRRLIGFAPVRALLVSLVVLASFGSGCNDGPLLEYGPIRKSPNFETIEKFVKENSFSSSRSPNIYLVFFDTLRPDLALKKSGAIKEFYSRALTFDRAYGTAAATWYSMFSLFHSAPGFLAYEAVPHIQTDTDSYGSIFLKILHKLNYKIDVYGYDWRCDLEERPAGTSWKRFLMTYFGWKSRLLDRCQSDPNYDEIFAGNEDEVVVAEMERKLPSVVTSPSKHMSFIAFNNNHNPYKWGAAKEGISENVGRREDFSDIRTTSNRYLNSVVASDINFGRLMKLLYSLPGHENAIVVLLSDHGVMLYEKNRESAHGGIPYREKIETVLAMELPEGPKGKKDTSSIASISDIFPTIFDYIGITPQIPSEFVSGRSLIRSPRKSTVAVRTNLSDPTREMVLINQTQKAWILVEESDFYSSKSFRLQRVTDLEDGNDSDLCDGKTPEECKTLLFSLFPDALTELYPDLESSKKAVP